MSNAHELGNFWTRRRIIGASLACATALFTPPAMIANGQPESSSALFDCAPYLDLAKYKNHEAEECEAYKTLDVHGAEQIYYKYGRSPNTKRRVGAAALLYDRYSNPARRTIERTVAKWPIGDNDVEGPHVDVLCAEADLATNTGTLLTREDVTVRSKTTGKRVYAEPEHLQLVSLRRTDGLVKVLGKYIHIWEVRKIAKPTPDSLPENCDVPIR